MRQLKTVDVL